VEAPEYGIAPAAVRPPKRNAKAHRHGNRAQHECGNATRCRVVRFISILGHVMHFLETLSLFIFSDFLKNLLDGAISPRYDSKVSNHITLVLIERGVAWRGVAWRNLRSR
jgi:hypothetical protein